MNVQTSISLAVGLLIGLFSPMVALAHDPGLSALALRIDGSDLIASMTLARVDAEALVALDADHDGCVTPAEFETGRAKLERVAAAALEVNSGGKPVGRDRVTADLDASGAVHLRYRFQALPGGNLKVRSAVLASLPRGHRQYTSIRTAGERLLGDRMLDANNPTFEFRPCISTDAAHPPPSSGQFLLFGVEHIATGYDHLVFLLGLLIVGGSFRASVKIITAFTVAHSITLALATVELIRLPPSVVEPLIAASVMYVGMENIIRRDLDQRWLLAFGFGLIHGCGFASVLRELGIGSNGTSVVAPLLSFNLGVELGQIALAAIVLPLVWKLKQRESYQPRYVPACSGLVVLAGAYWLAERILPTMSR